MRREKRKAISLLVAAATVLQMLIPFNFAFADTSSGKNITDNIIWRDGSITIWDGDNNIINPSDDGNYVNIPKNAKIKIRYNFGLPDGDEYEFAAGDYFIKQFPEEIKFQDITEQEFKSENIDGKLSLSDNTAKMTFDRIEGSEVTGYFDVNGTFEESKIDEGELVEIDLGYEGGIIKIGFKEPDEPEVNLGIEKTGSYDYSKDEILWTITVTTPSGIAANVTVKDEFGNNQEFVSGSFAVNGVTTSAAVTGTALSYTFPYPVSEAQTITYRTKPTSDAFSGENGTGENNDKVVFENTAKLYLDGDFKADAPSKVEIDWIQKSDGTISDHNGVKRIEWKVTVNNYDGKLESNNARIEDTIDTGLSLVENDATYSVSVKFDDDEPINLTKDAASNGYSYVGNKLTYNFGDASGFETAVLTYYTDVKDPNTNLNNNGEIKFYNKAILVWEGNFGSPSDESGAVIGAGGLINKKGVAPFAYINGVNDTITWTVEINRNGLTISDAVFMDEIPEGLEYVDGSFAINGTTTSTGLTVSGSAITYNFEPVITSRQVITYKTKIVDGYKELFLKGGTSDGKVYFRNSAFLDGEEIDKTGTSHNQEVGTQVVSKNAVDEGGVVYNYETGKVKWQIVVNRNKMPLKNAVLTDTIPEGMTFLPETFAISPTTTDGNLSHEGNIFTYTFPVNIDDEYTVTFETSVDKDFLLKQENLNKQVPFENKSKLSSDFGDANSNATVDVKNYIVEKNKDYVSEAQDYIIWSVPINAGRVTLKNIEISDPLQPELELDLSSVKLYKGKIDPKDGTLSKDGNALSQDLYGVTYENNVFTLKIHGETSDSYILEFGTDVLVSKAIIKNKIFFEGSGLIANDSQDDFNVVVDESQVGAGGKVGSITVSKVDANDEGTFLEGAEFKIYRVFDGEVKDEKSGATGPDGKILFDELLYKTYYIEETKAPDGYLRDTEIHSVRVNRDNPIIEYTFENKKALADIKFTKHDEKGAILQGAEFTLYNGADKIAGPIGSDSEGQVVFSGIVPGEYVIKETGVPTGYKPLSEDIEVEVKINEDGTGMEVTFTYNGIEYGNGEPLIVSNELVDVYGDISLHKIDADDMSLAGAEFTLYDGNGENAVGTSTSDADGNVEFNHIPLGTYVIKETKAPDGYLKLTDEITVKVERSPSLTEAVVTYSSDGTVFSDDEPTVKNKSVDIALSKVDKNSNPLAGAEFTLYGQDGDTVQTAVSNDLGEVVFTAVPEGTYTIKETRVPSRYKDYGKVITAVVTVEDSEAHVTFTVDGADFDGTVVNEKKPGGGDTTPVLGKIAVKKVDEDKKVLSGAEFTLYGEDGKVVDKGVTGSDGIVSFTALEPGTYVLKETDAPEGYVLSSEETEVTVKSDDVKTFTFTNKKEEPLKPGGIEIFKTDENGNPLSGAWFSLIDENGSTLQNVQTVDGRGVFEDVAPGKYTVKEVQAPAGYELSSSQVVSVTAESGETVTAGFVNRKQGGAATVVPASGNILINKVDENSMPLPGAEFILYNENNQIIGTAVSDESGSVMFKNLKEGKYFVKETKAPEGYEPVSDILTVDISESKTYTYRFRNVPSSVLIEDPDIPTGWEIIDDPDVPKDTVDTLPNTGSLLNTWLLAAMGFVLMLAGIALYRRKEARN